MDHLQEVCKLLRHVAPSESLQVAAKYSEITVRIYGPQMLTATHTLSIYPNSKIAKENFQGDFIFLLFCGGHFTRPPEHFRVRHEASCDEAIRVERQREHFGIIKLTAAMPNPLAAMTEASVAAAVVVVAKEKLGDAIKGF